MGLRAPLSGQMASAQLLGQRRQPMVRLLPCPCNEKLSQFAKIKKKLTNKTGPREIFRNLLVQMNH
jgi:hypothetical protein